VTGPVGAKPQASDGLRILLVADAGNAHIVRWAQGFSARGCTVGLVSLRALAPELSGFPAWTLEQNQEHFNRSAGALVKLGYLRAVPVVRQAFREFEPDVCSVHFASSYGLLAHIAGITPRVISIWGADVYEFPARSSLHRRLLQRILASATAVTSTSLRMADHAQSLVRDPIEVINFGVDTATFEPGPQTDRPFTIGTARTLRPKYGVDVLIEAFAQLANRHRDWRLRIAGDGPQRRDLESLAASRGIRDRVEFLGQLKASEIPNFMNSIDVFAALSVEESESFGVAVVEAGAAGVPAVVSDVGGLSSVVVDGSSGTVVPARNPTAAAEAIETLGLSPSTRQQMATFARQHVLANLGSEQNMDRMLATLLMAASGSAGPASRRRS